MRLLAALAVLLLLAGCAHRPGAGSYADAATTYAALSSGDFVEANPIIGWHPDPVVTIITALGVKQAGKYALEGLGYSHCQADRLVESAGWTAAGWNVAAIASWATGWGVVLSLTAAGVSYTVMDCEPLKESV